MTLLFGWPSRFTILALLTLWSAAPTARATEDVRLTVPPGVHVVHVGGSVDVRVRVTRAPSIGLVTVSWTQTRAPRVTLAPLTLREHADEGRLRFVAWKDALPSEAAAFTLNVLAYPKGGGPPVKSTASVTLRVAPRPRGEPAREERFDAPRGTPFVLAPGLRLDGPIEDTSELVDDGEGNLARRAAADVLRGADVQSPVFVSFTVANDTREARRFDLPPCLTFHAVEQTEPAEVVRTLVDGAAFQHGLFVGGWETVIIPARSRVRIAVGLYCLNEKRDPSEPGARYTWGVVTSDPDMRELCTLLSDRFLTVEQQSRVQRIVHDVAEGPGLTDAHREEVRAWFR